MLGPSEFTLTTHGFPLGVTLDLTDRAARGRAEDSLVVLPAPLPVVTRDGASALVTGSAMAAGARRVATVLVTARL
ncbi:hypothetical protein [Amycolatopsis sp. NBC_01286]|uniref:hypothetical protein n=1 Tax=Amycolatopsis sp. NBC_01286 TaxID=2903560 RepID=UPI002E0E9BFF|nr:hypothetical protein OG570_43435 [Amycolatopsis sp. NBC_01286]